MMKLIIWDFKNLAFIRGKILFTQPLKLLEKLFTQPFYVRKFLSPNPFLFGTNPSVNNERSLMRFFCEEVLNLCQRHQFEFWCWVSI